MIRDIRFALKLLWKDRGFAATAILTLAVCIGSNTAIFTIVNAVLRLVSRADKLKLVPPGSVNVEERLGILHTF